MTLPRLDGPIQGHRQQYEIDVGVCSATEAPKAHYPVTIVIGASNVPIDFVLEQATDGL